MIVSYPRLAQIVLGEHDEATLSLRQREESGEVQIAPVCHDSFDCLACRKKRQRYSQKVGGEFKLPEMGIPMTPLGETDSMAHGTCK